MDKIGCVTDDILLPEVMFCAECKLSGHMCEMNLRYNNRHYIYDQNEVESVTTSDLITEILKLRNKIKELDFKIENHGHRGLK